MPRNTVLRQLKIFALLWFGKCDIFTFRDFIHGAISEMAETTIGTRPRRPRIGSNIAKRYYCEFVLIAGVFPEGYISLCEKERESIRYLCAQDKATKMAADLPDFTTFLKFDRILRDFWQSADEEDKKKYYPLWLMWELMTILPLRVREFCVIPYDCIEKVGGKYYLTIRRTMLKGNNTAKIHEYYIEDDYQLYEYEVPEYIYDDFRKFQSLSKDHAHPNGLLMSSDFSHAAFGRHIKGDPAEKVFLDRDINDIMKSFYEEVVVGMYGMSVITKEDLTDRMDCMEDDSGITNDEIMAIQLKHLRHIAVINMVLSGCNITAVRDFCGHSNDLMTWNYYENASKTIALATRFYYDLSQKRKKGPEAKKKLALPAFLPDTFDISSSMGQAGVKVSGGKCMSRNMMDGNYDECFAHGSDCTGCPFFKPDGPYDTEALEAEFDAEMRYLRKLLFDRNISVDMDRLSAHILKTQAHGHNLASMYWANMTGNDTREEKENAEKT